MAKKAKLTKFTSKRAVVEVEIDDQPYILKEFGGVDLSEYTQEAAGRMQYDQGTKTVKTVGDSKTVQSGLIARCLYAAGSERRVHVNVISAWPATTISGLYDLCMDLNGLSAAAEEDAKKAPESGETTTSGSSSPSESADAPLPS